MFEDYRAELEVAVEKCGSWLRQVRGVLLRSLLVGSIASGYTLASAAQATIHVPADQPTIQSGIDAAQNGDTVLVAPGNYAESLDFKGKGVTRDQRRYRRVRGKCGHPATGGLLPSRLVPQRRAAIGRSERVYDSERPGHDDRGEFLVAHDQQQRAE